MIRLIRASSAFLHVTVASPPQQSRPLPLLPGPVFCISASCSASCTTDVPPILFFTTTLLPALLAGGETPTLEGPRVIDVGIPGWGSKPA